MSGTRGPGALGTKGLGAGRYVPGGHVLHGPSACPSLNVPAGQAEQLDAATAPAAESVSGGHG
eukprot:1048940-Rhodomonas_salina.1